MKSVLIFVLCLSLTACSSFTKQVNPGEDFTVAPQETVKVQGTDFRLKVLYSALSHYTNSSRSPVSCAFEITTKDKTEKKELDQGSSIVVEGFYIKLQSVGSQPDSCKFIVTKVE